MYAEDWKLELNIIAWAKKIRELWTRFTRKKISELAYCLGVSLSRCLNVQLLCKICLIIIHKCLILNIFRWNECNVDIKTVRQWDNGSSLFFFLKLASRIIFAQAIQSQSEERNCHDIQNMNNEYSHTRDTSKLVPKRPVKIDVHVSNSWKISIKLKTMRAFNDIHTYFSLITCQIGEKIFFTFLDKAFQLSGWHEQVE